MKRLFIGEIARRFLLNPRTIRYYETIGVLPRAQRAESGYRVYTDESAAILEFILKAKTVGLTLNEIREIDERIAGLSDLRERLTRLRKLRSYKTAEAAICPIIETS